MQDIAHAYLIELPLQRRIEVMQSVLGVHIKPSADEEMDQHTRTYITWMRVDESQKIFDFLSA